MRVLLTLLRAGADVRMRRYGLLWALTRCADVDRAATCVAMILEADAPLQRAVCASCDEAPGGGTRAADVEAALAAREYGRLLWRVCHAGDAKASEMLLLAGVPTKCQCMG